MCFNLVKYIRVLNMLCGECKLAHVQELLSCIVSRICIQFVYRYNYLWSNWTNMHLVAANDTGWPTRVFQYVVHDFPQVILSKKVPIHLCQILILLKDMDGESSIPDLPFYLVSLESTNVIFFVNVLFFYFLR